MKPFLCRTCIFEGNIACPVPSEGVVSAADASAEMRKWLMGLDSGKGAFLEYHGSISWRSACDFMVGFIDRIKNIW